MWGKHVTVAQLPRHSLYPFPTPFSLPDLRGWGGSLGPQDCAHRHYVSCDGRTKERISQELSGRFRKASLARVLTPSGRDVEPLLWDLPSPGARAEWPPIPRQGEGWGESPLFLGTFRPRLHKHMRLWQQRSVPMTRVWSAPVPSVHTGDPREVTSHL